MVERRAGKVCLRAYHCCQSSLALSTLRFHCLDAVHKLRWRLPMLQHHALIAAWRLPCHSTDKGVPGCQMLLSTQQAPCLPEIRFYSAVTRIKELGHGAEVVIFLVVHLLVHTPGRCLHARVLEHRRHIGGS